LTEIFCAPIFCIGLAWFVSQAVKHDTIIVHYIHLRLLSVSVN